MSVKILAWCPNDCDEDEASEYVGGTPREVAEQHVESIHESGDSQESYEVRVRAADGDIVREWDVTVNVEYEIAFRSAIAFPRKVDAKPLPTSTESLTGEG